MTRLVFCVFLCGACAKSSLAPNPGRGDAAIDGDATREDIANGRDAFVGECELDEECTDGLFCSGEETCEEGRCIAGAPPACDDGVRCTVDVCAMEIDGCRHVADSTLCGPGETCSLMGCQSECEGDADCTDGVFCNGQESCQGGACLPGVPPSCDDGVVCTEDVCDERTRSCQSLPNDEGCADNETCSARLGCIPECTFDSDCDDGLFCNGFEQCDRGTCAPGRAVVCNDGVECTADRCDEDADECRASPENARCDDGEICNADAGCVVECESPSDCDDGLFCNGDERCEMGRCRRGVPPMPPDDGITCTVAACDEGTDSFRQVPTDRLCAGLGGTCAVEPSCSSVPGCLGQDRFGHETYSSAVDPMRCAHTVIDISATGTVFGAGDDTDTSIALGGTGFTFFGEPMPSILVDSNGRLSSDLRVGSSFSNRCGIVGGLPGRGVRLFVYHDDLRANAIYQEYFALCPRPHEFEPSRGCNIIQWDAFHFGTDDTQNWLMQAVLYEGGEDMVFVYGDTREDGAAATVGYADLDGSDGVEWSCDRPASIQPNSSLCTYAVSVCD
ncbi:MAG: hypothetical protein AAF411_01640 [Myxococcota bacterium]